MWLRSISELTNLLQLEEDKIMSSGHSRISGIRARMELAWGKERSEHQRLIQETSKLAEELKNTLHEVGCPPSQYCVREW